ncbi:MAG: glycerate kinase type-2 family protein [Thermoplasmata archaeon]
MLNEENLTNTTHNPHTRKDFLSIIKAGIASVDAYTLVRKKLSFDGTHIKIANSIFRKKGRIFVVGAGKVAHLMAMACADEIGECEGVVLCPEDGFYENLQFLSSTHPFADEKNLVNTQKVLEILINAKKEDFVIFVVSGGASAMLTMPIEGLSLAQKNWIIKNLMNAGANIRELNIVRKHLSRVKGGNAALHTAATVVGLVLSDVPGGTLGDVGSGPTVPDWSRKEQAIQILKKYNVYEKLEKDVIRSIEEAPETPKFDNTGFRNVKNFLVGDVDSAVLACVQRAEELGYEVQVLTTALDVEARECGKLFAEMLNHAYGKSKKFLFLAGGESTVNLRGNGKGGRNLELVMGFLKKLSVKNGVILSFATDGKDGTTEWSGAFGDANILEAIQRLHLDIDEFLNSNNSKEFFEKTGGYIVVKNTRTNVGDIVLCGWKGY